MSRKPSFVTRIRHFASATNAVGWTEVAVATASATLAILLVYWTSVRLLEGVAAMFMLASMGASAILLFALPHGALSQPWPLFGGHMIAALVGVTCAVLVPQPALAAALAVGLTVGCMHLLRCVHPPGGATALTAVLGGPTVYGLGYLFVLTPLLLNLVLLFVMAVLINYPFPWRRYPAALAYPHHEHPRERDGPTEEDVEWAMEQMNVVVDVTAEELHEIARRAMEHARQNAAERITLSLGPRVVQADKGKGWVLRELSDSRNDEQRGTVRLSLVKRRDTDDGESGV
ncbi:HPP domain-containing protein [Thioalkalivibrio denitrificans]|uniref:HPP domain-containing protein n=1 Tax=Thioalkalivibrio denitrificans TaxID=108003 RepID=A0A1V3N8U8_9GAMM|nr:HPP family protein [Thioalkalivibrio denitrificans]OOG21455.1 HPP domain-containing protein [Thioalkalivibrio denitrificans]